MATVRLASSVSGSEWTGSAVPHGANEGFHVIEVPLQRLPSRRAQPVFGPRQPPLEGLGASDIPGLFQLSRVNAEVAVGGIQQPLELVERERLVHGQGTHDGKPHPLVDEPVELERVLTQDVTDARARIGAGRVRLSHRASERLPDRTRYGTRRSPAPSARRPNEPERTARMHRAP